MIGKLGTTRSEVLSNTVGSEMGFADTTTEVTAREMKVATGMRSNPNPRVIADTITGRLAYDRYSLLEAI